MLAIAVLPAALTITFGRMVGRPRQGWTIFAPMPIHAREQPRGHREFRLGLVGTQGDRLVGEHDALVMTERAQGVDGPPVGDEPEPAALGLAVDRGPLRARRVVRRGHRRETAGEGVSEDGPIPLAKQPPARGLAWRPTIAVPEHPQVIGSLPGTPFRNRQHGAMVGEDRADRQAGLTTNDGAHGLTEIFCAYASSFANNGQNMAGLGANTPFYNVSTAAAMLAGRFGLGILALALAGLLVEQRRRTPNEGTLPTDTPLFAGVAIGAILIVGGLTFFPALALGPIFEHLVMRGGGEPLNRSAHSCRSG